MFPLSVEWLREEKVSVVSLKVYKILHFPSGQKTFLDQIKAFYIIKH